MSDLTDRAEKRLFVSRLGKLAQRETDKDLAVIADLLIEVGQLEGEVFAWRMRNHKLADEVKRLTPREITSVGDLDTLPVGSVVRSSTGTIACRFDATRGVVFGDDRSFPWHSLSYPLIVLYTPEVQS